jgi:hypothetical protein
MEIIKYSLIVITFSCMSLITTLTTNYVTLKGSSLQGSSVVGNAIIGKLDPTKELTLTIVTGSLSNTQLVSSYYRTVKGIRVFDETDFDLKLASSVGVFSKEFKTAFIHYECNPQDARDKVCFAINSDIFIPQSLQAAIIGVLGLEDMNTMIPN